MATIQRPLKRRGARITAPRAPTESKQITASLYVIATAIGAPNKITRAISRKNPVSVLRGGIGGKATSYQTHNASIVVRVSLLQTHDTSLAIAVANSTTHTASMRIVAALTAAHTSSLAVQYQGYEQAHTASLAVYARATQAHTSSLYVVFIPLVAHTASVYVENSAYDTSGVPVGALRAMLYNSTGTMLGGAPLLTLTTLTRQMPMDRIGAASFGLSASDPLTAYVVEGNHVKLYHSGAGYLGEYIIQQVSIDAAGRTLSAQCVSILQELVWANSYMRRNYNNVAVSSVLNTSLISGYLYGLLKDTGWTPGTLDVGLGNVTFILQGESIYQAIDALRKRLGKHFREGTTARTIDFGAFGTDGGYRLIQPSLATTELSDPTQSASIGVIESLTIESETHELVNKIIPFGAGQGLAALTLEKSTRTTPYTIATGTNPDGSTYWYLRDAASVTQYGERTAPLIKSDIVPVSNSDADLANAANALYDVAAVYLARNSVKTTVYSANILRCPVGLKAGDKARVFYRGVVNVRGTDYRFVNVDSLLWVHDVSESYDATGARRVSLKLATTEQLPIDDSGLVVGMLEEIQIGKTHVQPYPSDFNDTFEEEIDASRSVTVRIGIDSRVLYLNSCKINLQTKPLRATFSTASSGGGAAVTSGAGGAQSPTSNSGGGTTTTSYGGGSHQHLINIYSGGPVGEPVYITNDLHQLNAVHNHGVDTSNAANHTHDITVAPHSHVVTIFDHTHSINVPAHGHGLTFGVTDDTQYPVSVRISIDGVDRTAALGGPWVTGGGALDATLDITTYLVNAAGGLRQNHSIVLSCASGQGKIRVLTKAFTTVQAIAVTT